MTCARTLRARGRAIVLAVLAAWATGGVPGGIPGGIRQAYAQALGATIAVRSGNHSGFGRVVIDTVGKAPFTLDQDGDHLIVRLTGEAGFGPPPALPRNVVAMKTDGQTMDMVLRHGAKVHSWRMDGRVVLDVLDDATAPPAGASPAAATPSAVAAETPAGTKAAAPGSITPTPQPKPRQRPPLSMATSPELGGRTAGREPSPAVPMPVQAQSLDLPGASPPASLAASPPSSSVAPQGATAVAAPKPAAPLPATVVVEAAQQLPPGRDVLPENNVPVGLRARRTRLPKGMDGTAFLVPFDSSTGAAVFRSGDSTYVVFDERRPVDLAGLKDDPVFGAATVKLLPSGTLLRLPQRLGLSIGLTQLQQGWRIAALTGPLKQEPIVASEVDGRLMLGAEQPSDVVAVADPDTGATLLVGTQRRPGQGVLFNRRSMEFILRPTSQGVVVEPLSDFITLKLAPNGFSLSSPQSGLALSKTTTTTGVLMDAAHLTRRLNFSSMPKEALLRLAVKQLNDAATMPPLARGPKHHAVAETFLALGLSAEAESLLQMAADQDPKEAASPDTKALTGIAALLAGRPEDSIGLMDPKLDGTDEIALWRAVRLAIQDEGSPKAAAVFSATAPLVFQYPATIRDRILPLMAETMIQGGEIEPAAGLLGVRPEDPKLAYARALLRQAEGDGDKALALFDAIAAGHDQFDRARAAIRAVELRLATGALDKAHAADALDKLLFAWRGDSRELALRQRIAELRGQTGAWRSALAMLRQAETDFPEQATATHDRLKDAFAAMIRDTSVQQVPPIEFVAMVEENTDLVPDSGEDELVGQALADRLMALDLPTRAKPVLQKLMKQTKNPTAKARFGTSLAMLDARDGNDAGALAMLDASEAPDLPADIAEQRLILRAGSVAHQGDPAVAAALLAPVRTARAMETRAQILETASDWAGAEQAWSDCVAATLPESGMLTEAQTRTVLRLATATARADDTARLATLRQTYGPRIGAGALGDMFRLLTAEPISATSDIMRSQREMNLAASLKAGLNAVASSAPAR